MITHLDRACRLWSDTQQQAAAAAVGAHAAEASGFALLAVDASRRIAYANANAERLLAERGCLVSRGGRIGAARADDERGCDRSSAKCTRAVVGSASRCRACAIRPTRCC